MTRLIRIPVVIELTGDYQSDAESVKITLAQIDDQLEPVLEQNLLEAAYYMKGWAQALAAYDTGSMRRSIHVEHPKPLWVRVRAGGYVTNPKTGQLVDYARYVEEGTRNMAAQPFMRPAWSMTKAYAMSQVEQSMRDLAELG